MKKKVVIIGFAAALGLLFASVVYACWGCGGSGMDYGAGASTELMEKLHNETQGIRNELMSKRMELQNEYSQPAPDTNRIADLRREIIAIQAQLRKIAKGYGFSSGRNWSGMMGSMMDMCPDMYQMGR